ncbi:MAG: type II toxin-antitoxin system VapC family toxin [Burkholderiaceae bacterium]
MFDASALAKRYAVEPGRERVMDLFAQATEVSVSAHCASEIAYALLRRRRDGSLLNSEFDRALEAAQHDLADMVLVPVDKQVERFALAMMENAPLPVLDALQVGSALASGVDLFVTASRRQAQAARALGLKTECLEPQAGPVAVSL